MGFSGLFVVLLLPVVYLGPPALVTWWLGRFLPTRMSLLARYAVLISLGCASTVLWLWKGVAIIYAVL
jgi:hypothetical protein